MICPKCNQEINVLTTMGEDYFRVVVDIWIESGTWVISQKHYIDETPRYRALEYRCPLCDEVLFTDSSEAEIFLLQNRKI